MTFKPGSLPLLIGSLPLTDHAEATELMMKYTPEIPLWVQLPCHPNERLLSQFSEGLPGIRGEGDNIYFETSGPDFEKDLVTFYEKYLAVTEGIAPLEGSIFAFSETTGKGLNALLVALRKIETRPLALKGQITGPFTMLIGLKDSSGRAVYFN
ncbi:MAG: hypothetical protein ACP5J5_03195, partial [Dissulfurimicrobium sp.]